jgi:hypothetical protein
MTNAPFDRVTELTTICHDLLSRAEQFTERAVLATPTGNKRNALTDVNIHIKAALEALELAKTQPVNPSFG